MNSSGPTPDTELIASNIRRGMEIKGISSRRASATLGVSETQFWRWRTAKSQPRRLAEIADLLFDGDINQLYLPADESAA